MKINEVDPRNYDSDIDYYNALRAKPKRAQEPDDLPEPSRPYTDKDAEDDISQQRQRADAKFRQKRKVEYVDQEGSAPNGKKHNKLYVIDAQDEATARHEEYLFDKHEWGAKKVVDTKLEKNTDGTVRLTLYIVDNHKYGFWRPWKDSPVRKESAELEEKAPPGMEDWINSRKADFKKRYGDKWQQVLYATAWKRHNNESVAEMDSQGYSGSRDKKSLSKYGSRDDYELGKGKEHSAKMTTADKMMKDAHDAMMQAMSKEDKVKKGWRNPDTLKKKKGQGVTEGASELLKAEMPLVRHIEQELTKIGYKKGTPEFNAYFNDAIKYYRQFGNFGFNKQGVAEGFFGIDDKIKGKIQNIVSRLSDEYGMWDHKAQTFTPDGLEHLKSILKFNDKYIKYALSLTSRDFEAEGVAEGSDNIRSMIQQYEDMVELVYDLPPGRKKNIAIDKRDALEAQIEAMPGGSEALRKWAKSYNDAMDEGVAEGVEIIDQDSDLDQQVYTLNVDGNKVSFTYWDYENNFQSPDIKDIYQQAKEQLGKKLSPEQIKAVARAVFKSFKQGVAEGPDDSLPGRSKLSGATPAPAPNPALKNILMNHIDEVKNFVKYGKIDQTGPMFQDLYEYFAEEIPVAVRRDPHRLERRIGNMIAPYAKFYTSTNLMNGQGVGEAYQFKDVKVVAGKRLKQGVAEGYDDVGNKIKALYQKIYDQGDDSIDYMYHESPVFAQISDEYEGDLDSIIAEVDPSELQVIANELEAYLQGPGLTEATNPTDVICLDVPLFIRLMEYAREDASTDMDLHDVAENAVKLSAGGTTLSMKNYESIIPSDAVEDETIKEAGMGLEQGRKNIISILKAGEQGQDAEIMVGGEPITLEYPEARFVGGRYKAFLKAGRQEEFLRALTNPQAFDRIMAKMRAVLDKQKNFRGSVPGERGVEEGSFHNPGQQDSPVAGAITRRILMQRTDLLAKHGPEKVGQAIDSVADFVGDVDEIGSSDVSGWVKQVERELGGVAETQVNEAGDVKSAVLDCFKQILAGAQAGDDMIDYLADELNDYYKHVRASRDPQLQKAYKHMMDNGQEAEGDPQAMAQVAQQAISMLSSVPESRQRKNPALAENQYWCNLDKQVKPIPEGYRKNNDGYLVRK